MKNTSTLIRDIIGQNLSVEELRQINRAVVDQIKYKRQNKAADVRATLNEGDAVQWSGRFGHSTGTVTKINRKNAKVLNAADSQVWSVPLTMLTAAK